MIGSVILVMICVVGEYRNSVVCVMLLGVVKLLSGYYFFNCLNICGLCCMCVFYVGVLIVLGNMMFVCMLLWLYLIVSDFV